MGWKDSGAFTRSTACGNDFGFASIFERHEGQPQLALPLFGARRYPAPILDHEAAARAFLARYRSEVAV